MEDARETEIEEWYSQYHQTIFKYILMMTKDYQQAEDLTHETFLKAFRQHHSFRQDSSPKTWLFRIAHNVTVDDARKKKPVRLVMELFRQKKDTSLLPEHFVEMKENSKELYQALEMLKDSHREVIIIRKIKGFSISETSEILGWSETKVKSTLSRAIHALEKTLIKEGYQDEQRSKLL
ncbi:RNA polymerase sigma factor [Metabacillus indicus]|uniref:RNA polymerase sigma factor n=1 Tax=Metabacillus indicus TaxID=246786 RepID=UPI00049319C9|nr:RNA polymerase sigma factor [Metabacillus indicus]KEZ50905.1 RNA polymerase subunit sigma-24 [Metabacillus indicus LMG 22858]